MVGMSKPKKNNDDIYLEMLQRLRHAAFALAGSANSLDVNDRIMAENYLKEAARYFVDAEDKAGRR